MPLSLNLNLEGALLQAGRSADLAAALKIDLGDLSGPVDAVRKLLTQLPADPKELVSGLAGQGLEALPELVKLAPVGSAQELLSSMNTAAQLVAQFVDRLDGKDGALVDRLLEGFGGLGKLLEDLVSRFLDGMQQQTPAPLRLPLAALSSLTQGVPADPAVLAQGLSGLLLSVDLPALAAPSALLDKALAPLREIGGDLEPLRAKMLELTRDAEQALSLLHAPEVDVDATLAVLGRIRAAVQPLFGTTIPALITSFQQAVAGVRVPDLATQLEALLRPLLALIPNPEQDPLRALVLPLRDFARLIDELTPASLTAHLAGLAKDIKEGLAAADEIKALGGLIDQLFEGLLALMRRVPLRRFYEELHAELAKLETRIHAFPGFSAPRALLDRIGSVEFAVQGIDTAAAKAKLEALGGELRGVIESFPTRQVATSLEQAVEQVGTPMNELATRITEVSQTVEEFAATARGLDAEGIVRFSVELRGVREELKKTLAGAADGPLGTALQVALGAAAKGLHELLDQLTPILDGLKGLVARIDPKVALQPLTAVLDEIRSFVQALSLAPIMAQLDAPFLRLREALEKLSLGPILEALAQPYRQLGELLRKLDPRTLVAPLQAEFEKLFDKLRGLLDLSPLFAPLKEVYGQLVGLIKRIDLEGALGSAVARVATLPQALGQSLHDGLAKRAGAAVADLPEGPFRFGDVLRPLGALLAELRQTLSEAGESVIGEALQLLSEPLRLLARLIAPGAGLAREVTEALSARRALVDPFAASGPAAALHRTLQALALAVEARTLSVAARAQIGGAVAAVQIDAQLPDVAGLLRGLDTALAPVPTPLSLTLRRLEQAPIEALVGDPTASVRARVGTLLDRLDPAPLVAEMDELGARIQARLSTLGKEMVLGLVQIIDAFLAGIEPLLPQGLLRRVQQGIESVMKELTLLDPARIEAELGLFRDAVLDGLRVYSPALLAARLGAILDAILGKLDEVDPVKLLAPLDPTRPLLAQLDTLRPSTLLQPLAARVAALEAALGKLDLARLMELLVSVLATLQASIGLIIDDLKNELMALVQDLKTGGKISVSASGSVSFDT